MAHTRAATVRERLHRVEYNPPGAAFRESRSRKHTFEGSKVPTAVGA
jgi:hypothetical protein